MKIKYKDIAFNSAVEFKYGVFGSISSENYDIELDTDLDLVIITDKGIARHAHCKDDLVHVPRANVRAARPEPPTVIKSPPKVSSKSKKN